MIHYQITFFYCIIFSLDVKFHIFLGMHRLIYFNLNLLFSITGIFLGVHGGRLSVGYFG